MTRALALGSLLLTGCLASNSPSSTQDPFCPKGWKLDISNANNDGSCAPPTGYTALVWAELGGSGVYGFVRDAPNYWDCLSSRGSDSPPCEVRMVGPTQVVAYLAADIVDTTIRAGAVPVATTTSSSQSVYKLRLDPGGYRITGIDPVDGTRFWSANLTVVPQALAACAIDVYPP
jgi:hypothetical protein